MTKFIVHICYVNGGDGEREYPSRQDAEIEAVQLREQKNVESATVEEVEISPTADITVTITHTITQRRIADMMVSCIETSDMVQSWCSGIGLQGHWVKARDAKTLSSQPWYNAPEIYDDQLELVVEELVDERLGEVKNHTITLQHIKDGLQWMAENRPTDFNDMISENDDAYTADIFLQSIVLREIVYG